MGTDKNEILASTRSRIPWRAIGLLVVIGAVFSVGLVYRDQLEPALVWVEKHIEALGPWGPLAYVLIYTAQLQNVKSRFRIVQGHER